MNLLYSLSIYLLVAFFVSLNAQNKKVGIGTATPTEILDVKETMRVRNLPLSGSNYINANGITNNFAGNLPVVSSSDNVIGKTSKAELVPNNSNSNFNTTNDSSAMFVIKRYAIGDWPSQGGNVGITTGMDAAKWEAIMSNVSFSFTIIQQINNVFNEKHLHSWALFINSASPSFPGGEWRIIGDINGVNEKSDYVDVLFIKKGIIANDPNARKAKYDF